MATSIRVSELPEYKIQSGDQIRYDDAFMIVSDVNNGISASYQISYKTLYESIREGIRKELAAEWENPNVLTSIEEVEACNDNTCTVGAKPIQEILKNIRDIEADKKSYWS